MTMFPFLCLHKLGVVLLAPEPLVRYYQCLALTQVQITYLDDLGHDEDVLWLYCILHSSR